MKNKTTVKIRKILSLLSLLTMIIVMGGTNPIDANEERGGDILKKFYSVRNESFQQEFEEESKVKDKYVEAVKTLENEFNNVEEIDYYSGCYINDENKFVVATNNKKLLKSEGV